METFKVFTKRLAIALREQGFKIVGTEVNFRKPQYDIYLFDNTLELRKAVENYCKKY